MSSPRRSDRGVDRPLERPRQDALLDLGRIKRLFGITPVQILQDVAGVDDDEVAVGQDRYLQPRIEFPQLLAAIRRQRVNQVVLQLFQIEADRDLTGKRADRASV